MFAVGIDKSRLITSLLLVMLAHLVNGYLMVDTLSNAH